MVGLHVLCMCGLVFVSDIYRKPYEFLGPHEFYAIAVDCVSSKNIPPKTRQIL